MTKIDTFGKRVCSFANEKCSIIKLEEQMIHYGNEEVRVNMTIDLGRISKFAGEKNLEISISGLNCKDRNEIGTQEYYEKDPINHFCKSTGLLIYIYSGKKEEIIDNIIGGKIQFLD